MDRLIYKEANGDLTCRSRDFEKIFPTLYAYEELELTPQEIEQQLKNFSSFLMEMTGGRMSKTNYTVQAMVSEANDYYESVCDECSDRQQLDELKKELDQVKKERDALAAELKDERHRHDRYVDFELDEAAELSRYKQAEKEGRLVILDAPMVPVAEDSDPLSSDVFCPRCGENLSGAYADEERILLQCFKCGQYIDGTKAMTYAEAEEWRKKEE